MQIYEIPINPDLEEATSHGSYAFPLAVYYNQLNRNASGLVHLHWHDELQFVRVVRGEVEFTVNQQVFRLTVGEGLFINSGCLHMAKPLISADSTYICLNVAARMLAGYTGSRINEQYIEPFIRSASLPALALSPTVPWQNEILANIQLLYDEYTAGEYGYELAILSQLTRIWYILTRENQTQSAAAHPSDSAEQERIKALLGYIHEHYRSKITLADIAASANISRGECCRFFKRFAKVSPFDYLIGYRINQSLPLLATTDLPVSQIAELTGFGTASYFIERFRKQLACSPLDYRRRHKHSSVK